MSIRVLVVDDSAVVRKLIVRAVRTQPDMEVAGVATNGVEAVELARDLHPDVITLDVEMPEMNGLDALRKIMMLKLEPRPKVLMCSSLTTEGSKVTVRALFRGADDFIAKDADQITRGARGFTEQLIDKIRALAETPEPTHATACQGGFSPPCALSMVNSLCEKRFDALVIGSSTGGPSVLETLVAGLPAGCPFPVAIAQHMPATFTQSLANRLDSMSNVRVKLGEHREWFEAGMVYIGQGGKHIRLIQSGGPVRVEIDEEPRNALYKPSVNELFRSASECFGNRVLGIMLTGMGDDGLEGARELVRRGGTLLAQSSESCVVYGMPKAVVEAGLVAGTADPHGLRRVLTQIAVGGGGAKRSA